MGWIPENTRGIGGEATGLPTARCRSEQPAACATVSCDSPALAVAIDVLRGADAGLRGPVRPAAAPDPEAGGRPLGDLPRADRRRVPRRGRAARTARSRRRDRVPAHRGHARRAEGAAPAPVAGGRSSSTRSCSRFEERDLPARPAARVQDVQGRGRAPWRRSIRRADRSLPRDAPAPRSRSASLAPDPLERVTPSTLLAAALRGFAPKPSPRDPRRPHRADPGQRARGHRGRAVSSCPSVEPMQLPASWSPASPTQIEVIVRFLACLELFKQGIVDLEQFDTFGDLQRAPARARRDRARCGQPRRVGRRRRAPDERARDGGLGRPSSRVRRPARRSHPRSASARGAPRRSKRSSWPRPSRSSPASSRSSSRLPVAEQSRSCARELAAEYERDGRGFTLVRVAGGYRFQTHPDLAPYVERFVLEGQHARLSAPALETLAIIAYKQPISRAQLTAIRGVERRRRRCARSLQRGYVEEVGHDPAPGKPCCSGRRASSSSGSASTRSPTCRRSATSFPTPDVVEALERGLRSVRRPPRPNP